MSGSLEAALDLVRDWGASDAAVAVVGADGIVAWVGNPARPAEWASVTKLVTAYAVLRAVERGSIGLDEPFGPSGETVRHVLAHASSLLHGAELPPHPRLDLDLDLDARPDRAPASTSAERSSLREPGGG